MNTDLNSINKIQNRFSLENFKDQFVKDNLTIDWESYKINLNEETLEEHYEFDTHLKSENYIENDKQKLSFAYKLSAFKNEQGFWQYELIKFLTDDENSLNTISNTNLDDFSGTVYFYNLEGETTKIKGYTNGKMVNEFTDTEKGHVDVLSKAPPLGDTGYYVLEFTASYVDWYANIGGGSTMYYTHSVYQGTTSQWVWVSTGGGYGGSSNNPYHSHYNHPHGPSGGSNNHPNENLFEEDLVVVFNPTDPITNVQEFLECFDVTQNATLTIYALEPDPGTGDTHNGTFVGHTFISIRQGSNTSTYGYYPVEDDIRPIFNESSVAVLGDDGSGNEPYTASLTKTITGAQLQQIINKSINFNSTYHLDNYNCTDFALEIGNTVGFNLPNCNGTWLGGGGSNPGTLGMVIRNRNLQPGETKNTTGGNAPATQKNC